MKFKIMGKHKGETEQLDTAEDRQERDYLLGEYRLAFGSAWTIWAQEDRDG